LSLKRQTAQTASKITRSIIIWLANNLFNYYMAESNYNYYK
jgi:hypothetical protein